MDASAVMYAQQAAAVGTGGYTGAPPPSPYSNVVPYGVEITNRVFVGGCPYNMTELEMSQFFSAYGEVKDAKIITDRDGGKSRGYGFVTFATEEQAFNVYSQGSIYYQQKKLNVSKAIRKYGGQYQKANQEYVNGQRLVWLHPNGYLMTQQENGWHMEQLPSHSQPAKPCYPVYSPTQLSPTATSPGFYYPQPSPFIPAVSPQASYTPMYGNYGNPYAYGGGSYPTAPTYTEEQPISVISTAASSGHASLESSSSSHAVPVHDEEGEGLGVEPKTMKPRNKHPSLDSAYTSEADLDLSHNTTAANSGTVSPKESCDPVVSKDLQDGNSPILQKLKKLSLGDELSTDKDTANPAPQSEPPEPLL